MKKKKSISSSKSKKSKKEKYRMKPNEFLFIYNIYNFEILHKRPNNDIKIYYFIKPEWFSTFKDFFNCKEIYKILDDNIKNDFFLNIIKADNIPDEFNKIKCKSDKIPKELYDFEYNGEYIIKLNEEDTQVSYYPFKVFILEKILFMLLLMIKFWKFLLIMIKKDYLYPCVFSAIIINMIFFLI